MRYEFCLFFFFRKKCSKKYITHNKEKYLTKRFLFMEDEFISQINPWFIMSLLEYFFWLSLGVLG